MKAIRLTNEIDIILANRTEDFTDGNLVYYLRAQAQVGTLYSQAKINLLKTYAIPLSHNTEPSSYDAIIGKSVDEFMMALEGEYGKFQNSQSYLSQLSELFSDIAGLVDSVVDL